MTHYIRCNRPQPLQGLASRSGFSTRFRKIVTKAVTHLSVATALFVVYLITITIVLLNLLVAVLSTSHAKVQGHADQEYEVLKARLIKHYRFVVQNDIVPAPFNLTQPLFRWHEAGKRRVGGICCDLACGWSRGCGRRGIFMDGFGFPAPVLRTTGGRNCFPHDMRIPDTVDHLLIFVWRVVACPLHLFGWWLTRP